MKSESILKKIVELCNEGYVVKFEKDLGGNSLTIHIDELHTHIGISEDSEQAFSALLDHLYDALTSGPGLSWA